MKYKCEGHCKRMLRERRVCAICIAGLEVVSRGSKNCTKCGADSKLDCFRKLGEYRRASHCKACEKRARSRARKRYRAWKMSHAMRSALPFWKFPDLLGPLSVSKLEFDAIARKNAESAMKEYGATCVAHKAERAAYLSRFKKVVAEAAKPDRSQLMLALALTGDRAKYDPDWEPDYE